MSFYGLALVEHKHGVRLLATDARNHVVHVLSVV